MTQSLPHLAGRAAGQAAPYIATMNARAEAMRRAGREVLKLSGGDPPHAPPVLLSLLGELGAAGSNAAALNYGPILGFEALRHQLAAFVGRQYRRDISPEQLMVTAGGCPGLFLALKTMVGVGDLVLVPDPCWEYLPRMVEQCEALPERLPPSLGATSSERTEAFMRQVQDRLVRGGVRALVVNSPLNPTGDVLSADQLSRLAGLCRDHGAWLLSDEVTVDFQYGGRRPDLGVLDRHANVVSVQSFSKNFGLTGLRFGFVIGHPDFIQQAAKTQLYTSMYPCSLVQELVRRYLELGPAECDRYLRSTTESYERLARDFTQVLSDQPGVEVAMPDGGLFLFPRVRGTTPELWTQALQTHGVAVSPGAAFGTAWDDCVRLFVGINREQMRRCAEFLGAVAELAARRP
jgi:aspartate/methionine/tyrosine aminotransferase